MMHRRAFTLIELLVVISVIAVLISLLLPAMAEAQRQTAVLRCMSQLRQIGVGLATFSADNDGTFPPPSSVSVAIVRTMEYGLGNVNVLDDLVQIAGGNPAEIYFCPLTDDSPNKSLATTP